MASSRKSKDQAALDAALAKLPLVGSSRLDMIARPLPTLYRLGNDREGTVRVLATAIWAAGNPATVRKHVLRVQWRDDGGNRKTADYSPTVDGMISARAFADAIFKKPVAAPLPQVLTLGTLWHYFTLRSGFPGLKARSQELYRQAWESIAVYLDMRMPVDQLTGIVLGPVFNALSQRYARSSVKLRFRVLRLVLNWGMGNIKGFSTPAIYYRLPKQTSAQNAVSIPPGEYTGPQLDAMIGTLDVQFAADFRLWVMMTVARYQGPRVGELCLLEWSHVDFVSRVIHWVGANRKTGVALEQPMTDPVFDALTSLSARHAALGLNTRYVFVMPVAPTNPATHDRPMLKGSVIAALHRMEKAAGIAPQRQRGFHALRRYAVTHVYELTNDPVAAVEWVGDGIDQAKRYLKGRSARTARTQAALNAAATPPSPQGNAQAPSGSPAPALRRTTKRGPRSGKAQPPAGAAQAGSQPRLAP